MREMPAANTAAGKRLRDLKQLATAPLISLDTAHYPDSVPFERELVPHPKSSPDLARKTTGHLRLRVHTHTAPRTARNTTRSHTPQRIRPETC